MGERLDSGFSRDKHKEVFFVDHACEHKGKDEVHKGGEAIHPPIMCGGSGNSQNKTNPNKNKNKILIQMGHENRTE